MTLEKLTKGPRSLVRKLNAWLAELRIVSNMKGDGLIQVNKTRHATALSINLDTLEARLSRTGGGDSGPVSPLTHAFFIVDSNATGNGWYNCYKLVMDATLADSPDATSILYNGASVVVYNMLEENASVSGHALSSGDYIMALKIQDDEANIRWMGHQIWKAADLEDLLSDDTDGLFEMCE